MHPNNKYTRVIFYFMHLVLKKQAYIGINSTIYPIKILLYWVRKAVVGDITIHWSPDSSSFQES